MYFSINQYWKDKALNKPDTMRYDVMQIHDLPTCNYLYIFYTEFKNAANNENPVCVEFLGLE